MKHQTLESKLGSWARELGIAIPDSARTMIVTHMLWLLDENRKVNLTAITDPDEAIRLHALDSLIPLQEIRLAPEGSIVDIGTGGGFPGLPLAVATGRKGVLVDSVQKKARAVESFVREVGLSHQIEVVAGRAEELALDRPHQFAVVTMRAVAELPSIVELAAPLLLDSGILVALKARLEESELTRGVAVGEVVGLEHVSSRAIALPDGGETRTVVVFRRVSNSTVPLPRRVGMAQKRPLA